MSCDVEEAKEGLANEENELDVGEAMEWLENEQSLLLKPLPPLHLRHSSFSNPSVASPT